MRRLLPRPVLQFLRREDGPTTIEFAVLLALVVVICLVVVQPSGLGLNAASEPVVAREAAE